MFSDDYLDGDMAANFFLQREEAIRDFAQKSDANTTYATKTELHLLEQESNATFATKTELAEVVVGSGGGLTKPVADTYYAPITGSTEYATQTALATGLSGKSDTGHTHTGVYQPAGSYLVAADITGKANASDVTTALAGKSDTSHTHTGLPSAILTTSAPSGASDTNVYSALESDARFASVAGAGITQTQADARYLQLTDAASTYETLSAAATALAGKSDTSHTHTGVYQPAGSYATSTDLTTGLAGKSDTTHNHDGVYASQSGTYTKTEVDTVLTTKAPTTNPVNGANNYAGRDYVDTQLATKANTTHNHDLTAYQTTANMLKVGTETQYPSKAYADTLYAPIAAAGSSGASPKHFWAVIKSAVTPVTGIASWNVIQNTSDLTLANTGTTGMGSGTNDVIKNATSGTLYVIMRWNVNWILNSQAGKFGAWIHRASTWNPSPNGEIIGYGAAYNTITAINDSFTVDGHGMCSLAPGQGLALVMRKDGSTSTLMNSDAQGTYMSRSSYVDPVGASVVPPGYISIQVYSSL